MSAVVVVVAFYPLFNVLGASFYIDSNHEYCSYIVQLCSGSADPALVGAFLCVSTGTFSPTD